MKPDVVIISGSRSWKDADAIRRVLARYKPGTWVIHGDCRGADSIAAAIAIRGKLHQIACPYFEHEGREARNESMVAMGVALAKAGHSVGCHTFPLPRSVGTLKFCRLARGAGLHVEEHPPGEQKGEEG